MPAELAEQPGYVHGALALFDSIGDREAIVGADRRLTFAELRREVADLAAILRDHGVRPGSAVLVMVANAVEGPILQLGLHLLGCRTMWIAPVTSRREILEFVRLAAPDVFIYDSRRPAADGVSGAEISASMPGVPVFCLGPDGAGPDLTVPLAPGVPSWDLSTSTPAPESFLQTSGTTGTPKLVHHRHGFYAQILQLGAEFMAGGFPVLRHLSHSPMWLASGQITTLFNLFTGGVLFLREDWDPAAFLRIVEAERINSTFVSPPMLYEVLDHPDLAAADFSSMFMFNVGAGPASPSRLRQAIARFGPVLRIVYGLSEAVVITALPGLTEDPEHPERLRSAGRPYGDVRIEIRGTVEDQPGRADDAAAADDTTAMPPPPVRCRRRAGPARCCRWAGPARCGWPASSASPATTANRNSPPPPSWTAGCVPATSATSTTTATCTWWTGCTT